MEGMNTQKKQANMIWYDKELKTSANMDYKLCKYMMKINGYEEICNRLWVSLLRLYFMSAAWIFTDFPDFLSSILSKFIQKTHQPTKTTIKVE